MNLTLETLKAHLVDELPHGPVEIRSFVEDHFAFDDRLRAVELLERGLHVGIFRGRFFWRGVDFDGHISRIADDTRPVWH